MKIVKLTRALGYIKHAGIADESSTMDEDMGGGEGVASSDDVNDISSAAQDILSTGIRYLYSILITYILYLNSIMYAICNECIL